MQHDGVLHSAKEDLTPSRDHNIGLTDGGDASQEKRNKLDGSICALETIQTRNDTRTLSHKTKDRGTFWM